MPDSQHLSLSKSCIRPLVPDVYANASPQVLKYEHGQKYEPHHDFFHDGFPDHGSGQRIATVLMYLCALVAFPWCTKQPFTLQRHQDTATVMPARRRVCVRACVSCVHHYSQIFP